jgi:hypothetical protein
MPFVVFSLVRVELIKTNPLGSSAAKRIGAAM